MRRLHTLAFVLTGLASAPAQIINGYQIGSPYNGIWNGSQIITVTGRILSTQVSSPAVGIGPKASLMLQGPQRRWRVDLGPAWFINNQPVRINIGDVITVSGSWQERGAIDVIYADTVIRSGMVIDLRDGDGTPYWNGYQPIGSVPLSPGLISGTIIGTQTVTYLNQSVTSWRVQTASGVISIPIAPAWYYNQQGFRYRNGDRIYIQRSRDLSPSSNIWLADAVYTNSHRIVLRANGNPVWRRSGSR